MKNKNIQSDVAVKVEGLSKSFEIPHQKIDSVRGAFVNLFSKKTYDEFKALDDVSFEIMRGEFVGILGHNGSGKSTLLKCLAKVYTPDEGTVEINGQISPFLELGIGFNPELSGRDNIYLNATILGLSQKEVDERFDDIVAFSEVGHFIDQQVKNYSSGMKGRLAFSVSIHANRDILLMDEVLAVGDGRFQQKCMDQFEKYKGEEKTVVLVTHNIGIVRERCDRAVLLHKGKVIMIGEPNEVVDRYVDINMTDEERMLKLETEKASLKKRELEQKKKRQQQLLELAAQKKRRDFEQREKIQQQKKEKEKKELVGQAPKKSKSLINYSDLGLLNVGRNYFEVEVKFEIKRMPETDIAVGVQLYEKNTNCFVFGTNTYVDDFKYTLVQGINCVKLAIRDHHFHIGSLMVDSTIFLATEKDGTKWEVVARASDDLEKREILELDPQGQKGGGIIRINHNWIK